MTTNRTHRPLRRFWVHYLVRRLLDSQRCSYSDPGDFRISYILISRWLCLYRSRRLARSATVSTGADRQAQARIARHSRVGTLLTLQQRASFRACGIVVNQCTVPTVSALRWPPSWLRSLFRSSPVTVPSAASREALSTLERKGAATLTSTFLFSSPAVRHHRQPVDTYVLHTRLSSIPRRETGRRHGQGQVVVVVQADEYRAAHL